MKTRFANSKPSSAAACRIKPPEGPSRGSDGAITVAVESRVSVHQMKVSLVINTFNRMRSLPNTLESLEALRYGELEVVVVDGPSTDGTSDYLHREWSGRVKICTCSEANLSKSRNIGVAHSSGDIVCFIDDDGVPEADWLDNLLAAYADPSVGAAGGWVRDHTGVDYQTRYIVSRRDATSDTDIESEESLPICEPDAEAFPGMIGVNSSFRKSALLAIGAFDEEYAYFLDETDVLARLVNAGYSVATIPSAEVHHKYAASHIRHESGAAQTWFQIIKSTAYFILKNAPAGIPLSDRLKAVDRHRQRLTGHTEWFLSRGMISKARYKRLLSEIELGADRGISDAYKYPVRQLLKEVLSTPWLQFPRPLAARERMRLAFVTPLYPPRPCGGVAVFIRNLARELARLGHEVTVITQNEPGFRHTVDFEERVWVHRLPENDSVGIELPQSLPDMPRSLRKNAGRVLAELDRVNDRRQFQFVIGAIWDLDLAAVIASRRYPVAMYLVTSYKLIEDSKPEWKENREYFRNHVAKMFEAERWALESADQIIASTDAIRKDTESVYGLKLDSDRLTVLPFGVPGPTHFDPDASPGHDGIRLLFVGRLEPRKGADDLLQAIPELMEEYPQLTVYCIGDNSMPSPNGKTYPDNFLDRHGNARWIDRVHFLGHVDDEALELHYAQCDIFVAPSRYESFGLIYLEAMRYGKPCIGTTAGGIPEVVIDGETGILVEPGQPQQLRGAISRLVANEEERDELGKTGRLRYQQHFTTEQFARNFEKLVSGWIENTGNHGCRAVSLSDQADEDNPAWSPPG